MIIPRTASRARRHPRARVLAVLAAFALTAMLGVFGATSPAVAEPTDDPTTGGTVTLVPSLGVHGAIPAGSALTGTVAIENGTGQQLSAARVALDLTPAPLADSSAVTAWVNSGIAAGTPTTLFSAPTAAVAASASLETSVLSTSDVVEQLAPGVYPLTATLSGATTGDGTAWDLTVRSVLTVRTGVHPVVSVLVPITATPASNTLLSADELATLTAADGALTAQLEGVTGTTAVVAVDPAIVAAIRVLGSSAPPTAVAWLDRLEALPNETFALQFGDADAATQAHAGLDALLQPTSLDTFMDVADFPVSEEATPTPTPTPTATAVPGSTVELPSFDDLVSISSEIDGILWPRGDVTSGDLKTFDGYVGGSATTILPSTAFTDPRTAGNARVDGSSVLVTDTDVSAALSAAAAEPDADVRQQLLAKANAALWFAGTPASGILIGLDRDETRTAEALRAVIQTSGAVSLSDLRATSPAEASLSAAPDAERATNLTTLLADEDALEAFATILEDPQVLLAPERIRLLRLLGVGLSDSDFTGGYEDHRAATVRTLNSVAIQDPAPIQLISANVDLPVWVRNDLPWPVRLDLEVRPSDTRVVIEPFTEIDALAQNNTRVLIPVESRVASGELQVRFTLTSPTGVPIGDPQTADVTVRAEWENIGLGILGTLIVLLLVFGVVRTVRRRRRTKSEAADAVAAEPDETDAAASDEGDR